MATYGPLMSPFLVYIFIYFRICLIFYGQHASRVFGVGIRLLWHSDNSFFAIFQTSRRTIQGAILSCSAKRDDSSQFSDTLVYIIVSFLVLLLPSGQWFN